jgi:hypothetical protein
MSEEYEKIAAAASIIKDQHLQGVEALRVVEDVAGTPDYAKLLEDKITCVCGRKLPLSLFPIKNTGVIDVVYNVCPECAKDANELAHLCCTRCRTTVGHIYPHKEPTGFEFKAGKFYHLNSCPQCSTKEKGKADIVEKVLFFKLNNIPSKSDPAYD